MIKDFILAALPFVIGGICLAIFFIKKDNISKDNYMPVGMCLGYSIGMAIGAATGHLGIGGCDGLLVGMTIGMLIPKNPEE